MGSAPRVCSAGYVTIARSAAASSSSSGRGGNGFFVLPIGSASSSSDAIERARRQQLSVRLREYQTGAVPGRVFDDTLKFPTAFTMKIIGPNDSAFVADILTAVSRCVALQAGPLAHSTKETEKGNYLSITISPVFGSSAELYAAYEAVCKDARVKFVL